MITTTTITRIEPQTVGAFISQDRYQELAQNFRNSFAGEVTSVTLSKAALETILNDANVSGIKFMNGLENANDPTSRLLVLMPANYTSPNGLPNAIIKATGFLTNTGNVISLEQTWQVLFNHVLNFKKADAQTHYTRINRGSFLGRNLLTELVNKAESENLTYHFGYDMENNYPYKALIKADIHGFILDESYPCPGSSGCPKDGEGTSCALTHIATTMVGGEAEGQLNVLRAFRDKILQDKMNGAEIERYYSISASLLEAIDKKQNQQAIFKAVYDQYIKTSLDALAQQDEDTAYILFQEAMEHLTETYLYQ